MDKEYFSSLVAESLGTAQGIVDVEHKLMNDGKLEVGMKRQLQEIHNEDEQHVKNLEKVLDELGHPKDFQERMERGRRMCEQIIRLSGDDPIDLVKGTILAKYRLADSQELFYNLCDEVGYSDVCEVFETNLEEEEDQLDYLREQAMLMARERITGTSATK
jgi:ferritin-like metal-binding protein YciE